jgi:hypothetical protein
MAQHVVTQLVDDLDGSEAVETIEFVWEGIQYRIDLNEKNGDKFRKVVAPFLTAAQRIGGRARRNPGKAKSAPAASNPAAIRAWAQDNGYEVPARGRIPNEIREAYQSAIA